MDSHEERANALLARMTLAEKSRQVSSVLPHLLHGGPAMDRHLALGIGHVAPVSAESPQGMAETVNTLQRYLVEQTRLGIPALFHGEALNGFVAPGYTSFPTPIGMAAAWDPDAVRAMADVIRRQMRSVGVRQALSPVMDIARDARWGRVHETFGEDVYLTSAMSVAFVQGLHGADLGTEGVLATAKHFLGYAVTEAGQNMAATHFGPRELYDVYATPFEAAIRLAGLGSVMNSYSEIDGVPVAASREVLTDLLRGRLGFTGSVVSDYHAVGWLRSRQFVAESDLEAGVLALTAGLDVELPNVVGYGDNLVRAVECGRLSEDVLDDAVRRVLVDKFKVGLFDDPYAGTDPIVLADAAADGAALSRRLAEESVTLLKNDGVLPLARDARVAVIGPNAEDAIVNFAAYTYPAMLDMYKGLFTGESRMAGLDGMRESEPGPEEVAYFTRMLSVDSDEVARTTYGAMSLADAVREVVPGAPSTPGVSIAAGDPQDVPAAVALARDADVVVLALGGRAGWYGTRITEGEGSEIARIELPPHQVALVEALAATGTPLVGVVYQGRAHALTEVEPLLNGIVVGYYPGPHGARAITSVLFGDVNPSGKLPYTMPRGTGQVPIHYGAKRGSGYRRGDADVARGYVDLPDTPLYAFGHGLSYTTFTYGAVSLDATEVPTDGGTVTIGVEVTNSGDRDGTEVVQFYVSDTAPGVTRPALQLVGFARAELSAGRTTTVTCTLATSQLGYSGVDGRFVLDPGPIDVLVGSGSEDIRTRATFMVTGDTVGLEGRRSYLSHTTSTPGRPLP